MESRKKGNTANICFNFQLDSAQHSASNSVCLFVCSFDFVTAVAALCGVCLGKNTHSKRSLSNYTHHNLKFYWLEVASVRQSEGERERVNAFCAKSLVIKISCGDFLTFEAECERFDRLADD